MCCLEVNKIAILRQIPQHITHHEIYIIYIYIYIWQMGLPPECLECLLTRTERRLSSSL